ncbi:MAG: hypothetical protein JRH01_22930 [Deltaproteobacteria bacterium]|nr:hypothetical protein [Deltaproteobacteria bacterium]
MPMNVAGTPTSKIGVLTNLKAGGRSRKTDAVLAEAGRHAGLVHVVNGGDGTLQRVLTEILGHTPGWRPRIAPLRSGRTNMAALDFGASRSPVLGLRNLVEDARRGSLAPRVCSRPVLRMELTGEGTPHFGMFFGAGAVYRAIQLTHRSFPKGKAQGVLGGAVMIATFLPQLLSGRRAGVLAPDKVQLTLDEQLAGTDTYLVVAASTLDRLFLRMRPFWGEGPGPVRLTTMTSGARGIGRALPQILRGLPPTRVTDGFESCNAHEGRFRLDCGVTLDGELFAPKSERVVRLTAPERVDFLRA